MTPLPQWPNDLTHDPLDDQAERDEAVLDYYRASARAAMARLRDAVELLDSLAQGDDWIKHAVERFQERIGPLPPEVKP